MKWSTNKIVEDLELLTSRETETADSDGDHYCRDIYLMVGDDGIRISGFNLDGNFDPDDPEVDIEYVEVRTLNSDSAGGYPKRGSAEIKELYTKVVEYFNGFKIEIVDNLKDYF